ncbi:MAG TPA: hypothetical protein VK530_21065 [Candidatus Acidoferrum sp.]|nr:hypothetical protein [Candidatus Acidoferrum sp.]
MVRAEGERLGSLTQREQMADAIDLAQTDLRAQQQELASLRKDVAELARLRNEVAQLRREADLVKQRAVKQEAAGAIASPVAAPTRFDVVEMEWAEVPEAVQRVIKLQTRGGTIQKIVTTPSSVLTLLGKTNRAWSVHFEGNGGLRVIDIMTHEQIRDGLAETTVTSWTPRPTKVR